MRRMKNKLFYWVSLSVITLLSTSCMMDISKSYDMGGPMLMLLDSGKSELEGVPLYLDQVIDQQDTSQIVTYVVDLLKNGVRNSKLSPTIPEQVELEYFTVTSNNVRLNFNREYFLVDDLEEIYMRSSLVRSLTSFDVIRSVEIYVDGVPIRQSIVNGKDRLNKKDVIVSFDELSDNFVEESINIYYPNEDKKRLVLKNIIMERDGDRKREAEVIDILLQEIEAEVLPEGTKLLNTYTHEEVCFVDFSEEFNRNVLPEGISEEIAVYSIVNSLIDLPDISEVQFLVEGKKISTFHGVMRLDRRFKKNYLIIE